MEAGLHLHLLHDTVAVQRATNMHWQSDMHMQPNPLPGAFSGTAALEGIAVVENRVTINHHKTVRQTCTSRRHSACVV